MRLRDPTLRPARPAPLVPGPESTYGRLHDDLLWTGMLKLKPDGVRGGLANIGRPCTYVTEPDTAEPIVVVTYDDEGEPSMPCSLKLRTYPPRRLNASPPRRLATHPLRRFAASPPRRLAASPLTHFAASPPRRLPASPLRRFAA